ncbi:MAG: hypothetical protein AVDCRST_MAG56-3337 [uncultured Cytophagales bacterium]|uniref:Uncharacterized protein n=1 Tax=uncultured Cytophagales bacterium TaxID=158755 RepID=A0A6J4J862_9SPHI|nr:MAG: hypothetical protein AVDCRST_MAG56-3337 [uncultured Cytophagales bacterium]
MKMNNGKWTIENGCRQEGSIFVSPNEAAKPGLRYFAARWRVAPSVKMRKPRCPLPKHAPRKTSNPAPNNESRSPKQTPIRR